MCVELKSMLRVDQLVEHMKNKNIKFDFISEKDAENYFKKNNSKTLGLEF